MNNPIVIERHIQATPEKIFSYLVKSSAWVLLQGGVACDIDATEGGIFQMEMPDGATARGQFIEVLPHSRVVFSWGWVDNPGIPPGSSIVTIGLAPSDLGTTVTLEHKDLVDPAVPPHLEGWLHYLGRLDTVATGGEVAPITGE
jgi:uncharacterized protein YndB with AHSA1/START domain